MRAYIPVLISVLLGAVVGGLLLLLPLARQYAPSSGAGSPAPGSPQAAPQGPAAGVTPQPVARPARGEAPAPSPRAPSPGATIAVAPPVLTTPEGAGGDLTADALAAARALVAAGRWREAQDEYVQVLLIAPDDQAVWAELVAVRRRLARDDAALLRRQAEAYRRAIARGEETEEHYTVPAMRILAQASVMAAQAIEQGRPLPPGSAGPPPLILEATPGPTPSPAPAAAAAQPSTPRPRPSPRATRRPTPRATARVVPSIAPAAPKTPAAAQTPRPTPVPLDVNEPFLIIRVGPIFSTTRASEVAGELTIAGYAAQVSRVEGTSSYFVTLGPYRRSVTAEIVRLLRSRFPGLPVSVSPAP